MKTPSPKITFSNESLKKQQRFYAWITVLLPLLGSLLAIPFTLKFGVSFLDIQLLLIFWALNGIGIEVGFHRYFSHCSFQAHPFIRAMLAILGSMAGQGPVIYWVATHRRHHQFSDIEGDPHSPNNHGGRFWYRLKGLWHAHIGWIFELKLTNTFLFAKDLLQDPVIAKINQLYFSWLILGLSLPAIIAGVVTQTWLGMLSGLLWGGLIRLLIIQQSTYAINSICHVYGDHSFCSSDQSTNNIWLAILTWGGAWHNNHHAFMNSAKSGLYWWQIDPSYWVISLFKLLGLARNIKIPTLEQMRAKKTV